MMPLMKSMGRAIALLVILPACAGCSTGKIESTKAAGYNKLPQSMVVFLPTGFTTMTEHGVVIPGQSEAYVGEGFNEVWLPFAANCHVTVHTNIEDKKDGKPQPLAALITENNPDWVITVEPTQARTIQQTSYGVPMGIPQVTDMTYNTTVIDRADNKKVWRANVTVHVGQHWLTGGDDKQAGRNTAITIINQMRKDGLLTTCPALPE